MRSPRYLGEILLGLALCALIAFPASASAETHHVDVQNFAFVPKDIVVEVGDTIQWNWVVGPHTVSNGTGPGAPGAGTLFDEVMGDSNPVFTWEVPDMVGLLPYYCLYHYFGGMTGSIDIQPAANTGVRHDVIVRNFEFDPDVLAIASGDTVCWVWESGFHTTTSGASSAQVHNPGDLWDAAIDSGNPEFCYVFEASGLYNYFCTPHENQGMTGVIAVDQSTTGIPREVDSGWRLLAPYPNPSAGTHNMTLVLEKDAEVQFEVFDLQGRVVYAAPTDVMPRGNHTLRWSGETHWGDKAGAGIYMARVRAGDRVFTAKMFRAASSPSHHH